MDLMLNQTLSKLSDKTGMNETRITYTHVDNPIIPSRVVETLSMIPT